MNPPAVLARMLVAVYGTNDPFELIKRLGLVYVEAPLPERIRGFETFFDGIDAICINSSLSGFMRRYAQAHELGHYLLGHTCGPVMRYDSAHIGHSRHPRAPNAKR